MTAQTLLAPRLVIALLAASLLLAVTARADDFALPAPAESGTAVAVYGSWYHMVNRRTVSKAAPYGRGSSGRLLVPFRSVAADRRVFPPGTVLYIPELRGRTMRDGHGKAFVHDGYVMVTDSGSGVRHGHIDFFAGGLRRNPAPLLFNGRRHHFKAYVVTDPAVIAALRALHDPKAPYAP